MRLSNRALLEAMARDVPEEERLLVSTVPGDPEDGRGEVWNVRPWFWGDAGPPPHQNNYVAVSAFRRGEQGWRRKAEAFGRAVAFMVDDVGTKVPRERLLHCMPTAAIETSPGNEQWWYLLSEPCTDPDLFTRVQRAFVHQVAGGRDPGMAGVNRVGRLPEGINGKRKYASANGAPFEVRTLRWVPEARFKLEELVQAFALVLEPRRDKTAPATDAAVEERAERAAEFQELLSELRALGMVLKPHANVSGRIPIVCPWYTEHTGAAKNGTYLVEPNAHNHWRGSFVCFHSGTHNDNNHLKDIRSWTEEVIHNAAVVRLLLANNASSADAYAAAMLKKDNTSSE